MKLTLKNVRLSFPNIWTAKAMDANSKPAFNAAFLIPKDDPQNKVVQATIEQVAKDKWGPKADAILKDLRRAEKTALKDGENKSQYAGYEGMNYVNASNATRPTILDRDKSPLTEADGRPYGGCYVNAVIEIWAQDNSFGKRINASLSGIQFAKDGDAFAGGSVASEDDFDDLGAGADADELV